MRKTGTIMNVRAQNVGSDENLPSFDLETQYYFDIQCCSKKIKRIHVEMLSIFIESIFFSGFLHI